MRTAYLDYAMSVIVGRALPDVRDGLKPVHRRVLYAMNELGLGPTRSYAKCAKIVGEVMGNYHPHGDSAIYDALVRMAQDFSMRNELVDGQGNFGSVDDDPAAAMRYTEARLARIATEMLRDLDMDTVDFAPNYDGSRREPLVLPARFPNLLVNGSSGIAVGMATNIPPHNLREVIAATIAYIDDPDIDTAGLMRHIKGPDFPTGGIILGHAGIKDAYETGRGRVRIQARAHIEPLKQGKEAIVVTELPFMVKKGGDGGLISKIADLVHEKRISEISDLRDESDKRGMRLVIELKRDAIPKVVLNKLYKHTLDADDVRREHGRARRQRSAHAPPARRDPQLRRPPARSDRQAHQARALRKGGSRAHPRGPADRAGAPRRDHRIDPRLARPRRGPRAAGRAASSSARSRRRRSSTCACRS